MKYILLTTFVSLFSIHFSLAQPTQGDYIIGGSVGFGLTTSPADSYKRRSLSFSILPVYGKFISEKYLLEGGLGYSFTSYLDYLNSDNFNRLRNNSFSMRFGATRFFSISEKLFFTVAADISAGYGIRNAQSYYIGVGSNKKTKNITGRINISPGLSYFINKRWMLYISMGAIYYNVTHDLSSGITGHIINASLSANNFIVGINYIFEGKKR